MKIFYNKSDYSVYGIMPKGKDSEYKKHYAWLNGLSANEIGVMELEKEDKEKLKKGKLLNVIDDETYEMLDPTFSQEDEDALNAIEKVLLYKELACLKAAKSEMQDAKEDLKEIDAQITAKQAEIDAI